MLAIGDLVHYNVGHKNQTYGLIIDVCTLRIQDYGCEVVDEKACRIVWLKKGQYVPAHLAKKYGIVKRNYMKGYTNITIERISDSGMPLVYIDLYYPVCTKDGSSIFKVIARANK